MKVLNNVIAKSGPRLTQKQSKILQCYFMIALPLIGFVLFIIYPYIWTINKAWYYYTGNTAVTRFVGWDNFIEAFHDIAYWKSWGTTFKLAIYKVPIELPFAMMLAIILNKGLKGSSFFRTVYFMPSVISVAILGLIITNMFDYFGFINAWLVKFGIIKEEIEWFGTTFKSLSALVIGSIWSSFGVNVMYFLAALANVDEELYEAAYLDGASKITVFFKITLPLIAPVMQTILLLAMNSTLHACDLILVTTGGAPGGTTNTVMAHIVNKFVPGFAGNDVNIGYGCALSLITSVMMSLFAVFYMKISKKMSEIY